MIPSNELVNTKKGLIQASNLEVGDLLLTHKRRYKPLLDIQWEYCQIYNLNVKCRTNVIKISNKTKLLTFDGLKIAEDFNKFKVHSICFAQEISLVEFPDEINDLYGGRNGQTFCPVNYITKTEDIQIVYNLITEDNSFCIDGIAIFNR